MGQPQAAVELIARAAEIDPHVAAYRCNLGVAYQALGRLEDAVACYQQANDLQQQDNGKDREHRDADGPQALGHDERDG